MDRRARASLVLMVVLCLSYTLSHFYRTSVGVLAPSLIADMRLSAEALGVLGGMFFLVFAVTQVPAGVFIDRFGPRAVNATLFVVAAIGAVIFAAAPSATVLAIGRGITGLGCATAYIGALVLVSRWFPPRQFPFLASIVMSVGSAGGLIATTPLALVAEAVGWRGAFVGIAAITVMTAGVIWLMVRDRPPGTPPPTGSRETLVTAVRGVGTVLANRQLHFVLPLNAVSYASVATILGLWGAPYLKEVQGLGVVAAANVLMGMSIMAMAGTLAYGAMARFAPSLRWLACLGAGILSATCVVLALLPPGGPATLYIMFGLAGFAGAYPVVLVTHVRSLFPQTMVGRGLTVANLFNFGGVGLMQVISGWIVGAFATVGGARPPEAYSAMFWFLAVLVGGAAIIYGRSREPSLEPPEPASS